MERDILDWTVILLVAAGLGGVVGIEREVGGHAAGIRTQALVAVAAALVTAVGGSFQGLSADPTRIASQVVTGMGFIGAGVIIKNGFSVRGLTTAGTLWMTTAIGIAVGADLIGPAIVATAITVVISFGLGLLKPLLAKHLERTLDIRYEQGYGTLGPLVRELRQLGLDIQDIDIEDDDDPEGLRHVSVRLTGRDASDLDDLAVVLRSRPEVRAATVTQ